MEGEVKRRGHEGEESLGGGDETPPLHTPHSTFLDTSLVLVWLASEYPTTPTPSSPLYCATLCRPVIAAIL